MKTEVRKEHGDCIVFVDDNPQFSFMYREEAEKVRNLIDVLLDVNDSDIMDNGMTFISDRTWNGIYSALREIGVEP